MPPSAIWDLFFESFYFRHYFHECVARVEIIENKMTRKINLILHEIEVYVKRFIVWYDGIRSLLAKPPIFTDESFPLSLKLCMIWFSTGCGTGNEILVFFALTPWSTSNQNENKTKRFTRQRQKQTGKDFPLRRRAKREETPSL